MTERDIASASGVFRVLDLAARALLVDLDVDVVLERVLEAARELTGGGMRHSGYWIGRDWSWIGLSRELDEDTPDRSASAAGAWRAW